jgi:DNA replication protein DnaC
MIEQVRMQAHALRLFGVHQSFERRVQEALADSLHPMEMLQMLLEDEQNYRKNVAAKRLITRAKFRSSCDLEDWDQTFDRGLIKAKLKELALLNFYYKMETLLIVGKTGEGKTHLAISIGNRMCQEGISTAFHSVNLLFEEIRAAKVSGTYLSFLKKITKTKGLILDDFALRAYTHDEANALLEIIEERYRKGVTIVTSQVTPAGWYTLFEDKVIAEAIVDRLTKPSEIIELKGGSYRDRLGVGANKKIEKAAKKQ